MSNSPARLTFPGYDIGAADILADGRQVGIALAEFKSWRGYLYPAAQDRRMPKPEGCEEATGRRLADLRRELRERVELKGPWWSAEPRDSGG